MLEPFMDRRHDRCEPSISIGSTTRGIGFLIVFVSGFRNLAEIFLFHFLSGSSSIPDEKLILTFDDEILWMYDWFPIDEVVDILTISCEIHLAIVIDEVATSWVPEKIREKVSPCRRCHMDMDEITLVLMEVDAILRLHIGRDIAARGLFHIDISTEVPLFSFDEYGEVGMIVNLIWTGGQYIRNANRYQNENEKREKFD